MANASLQVKQVGEWREHALEIVTQPAAAARRIHLQLAGNGWFDSTGTTDCFVFTGASGIASFRWYPVNYEDQREQNATIYAACGDPVQMGIRYDEIQPPV